MPLKNIGGIAPRVLSIGIRWGRVVGRDLGTNFMGLVTVRTL